jgi:nucleoside-diphosphate-sugar epimerase
MAFQIPSGEIVLITGANGFLGEVCCRKFTEAGYVVRALARNPDRARDLAAPGGVFRCDLPEGIDEAAFQGRIGAVVHCAYTMAASTPKEARRVNVEGTEAILRLARRAGARRTVFVSSLSAHAEAESVYGRTKLELERLFTTPADTIVKPGTIIGDGGVFARTREMLGRLPVVPLFYGDRRLQTIWVEDAADGIVEAVRRDLAGTFVLAHAEAAGLRDFYNGIGGLDGRRPRLVPFPGGLALALVSLAEKAGLRLPIHSDNLLGLKHLRYFDPSADLARLGLRPLSFAESLIRMGSRR